LRSIAWSELTANRRLVEGLILTLGVLGALAGGLATAAINPVAGVAAIIGLVAAVGVLVNIQVGLLVFVFVATWLPFAVIPVPIGGLKPTFIDAILTGLLFAWVFRLLAKPGTGLVRTPLDPLLLIFIGLAITSFTLGVLSVTAEVARFFLKTINSLLFFFTVTNCLRQRGQLNQMVKALLLAGFGASAIALAIYVLEPNTANRLLSSLRVLGYPSGAVLRYIAGTDTLRAIGTSIDPNILGGTLVLVIPLGLSQLFAEAPLFRRWQMVAMLSAMGLTMILTFSRGSWVGLTAAILFLAGLRYRRLLIFFVLFAAILYFLPMGGLVVERVVSGLRVEDQAAAMRLGEYKDALRLIAQYPWLGVGFGGAPSIDLYVAASSIYLLMAEEMGLVGLGVFLITMIVLFVYVLGSLRGVGEARLQAIQIGALGSVVGALTAGIFDHYFFNLYFPHTVALFWLFVGLAVVATKMGVERADPEAMEGRVIDEGSRVSS
jgi:O-antigen ligase